MEQLRRLKLCTRIRGEKKRKEENERREKFDESSFTVISNPLYSPSPSLNPDHLRESTQERNIKEAVVSQTSFCLCLTSQLSNLFYSTGSNLAFSPLSIHSLLSLLTVGCTGYTRQQLLSFLGSSAVSDLTALYSEMTNVILADGSTVGGPHLCYACGVWVDDRTNLKSSFRDVVGSVYKAEAHSVPFRSKPEECRKKINKWVKQFTSGHIKDLFPPKSITKDTRLVLGNAIYFKASWATQFHRRYSKTNNFQLINGSSIKTDFMAKDYSREFISVYNGFKVLKLPYNQDQDSRQFSFCIFLPDALNGLPNLSMKFSTEPDFLNRHIPTKKDFTGKLRIPKFKISVGLDLLTETLKNLGLVLPFQMTGEITEMVDLPEAREYFVSKILHKCSVEVDEEGTEGAVASLAETLVMGTPKRIDFVADHPFMFLIREDITGVVLFVGHLLNPLLAE